MALTTVDVVTAVRSSPRCRCSKSSTESIPAANDSTNGVGSADRLTNTNPCHDLAGHAPQRQRVTVDLVGAEMRRADQSAIECVRPGVIRAGDAGLRARPALLAQPRAAMAADIGVRVQVALAVLDQQHALAGDIGDEPVAGRETVVAAHVEPRLVEDLGPLELVHLIGAVFAAGEGGDELTRCHGRPLSRTRRWRTRESDHRMRRPAWRTARRCRRTGRRRRRCASARSSTARSCPTAP